MSAQAALLCALVAPVAFGFQPCGSIFVRFRSAPFLAVELKEPDIKAVTEANLLNGDACFVDDAGNPDCVEFPPPLSAPERVKRALTVNAMFGP